MSTLTEYMFQKIFAPENEELFTPVEQVDAEARTYFTVCQGNDILALQHLQQMTDWPTVPNQVNATREELEQKTTSSLLVIEFLQDIKDYGTANRGNTDLAIKQQALLCLFYATQLELNAKICLTDPRWTDWLLALKTTNVITQETYTTLTSLYPSHVACVATHEDVARVLGREATNDSRN